MKNNLLTKKFDAVLISSVPNIIYLTNYSGFSKDEREAYLLITKGKQYILTDGRYATAIKSQVKNFELIEISPKNPFLKAIKKLKVKHKIKKIGFEGNDISFLEHKKLLHHFDDSNHPDFEALRSIKTAEEISAIEKACQLGDKTFEYILKKIKLGISEKELAFEIEFFIKKEGADISFPPIVAFGPNSATPHHQTSDQRLMTKDKFVLLDFGVKLNNYCSDMTRTVFFGRPTNEQKKMYQTVLEAQQNSIDYLHKNRHSGERSDSRISYRDRDAGHGQHDAITKASDVDRIARDYIVSKGYPSIPHSLGHGIGLEVHESPHLSPKSKDLLKEGMVFSIEPGIYIPGFGGVRIEDLVVLEKNGPRVITRSPKTPIEF